MADHRLAALALRRTVSDCTEDYVASALHRQHPRSGGVTDASSERSPFQEFLVIQPVPKYAYLRLTLRVELSDVKKFHVFRGYLRTPLLQCSMCGAPSPCQTQHTPEASNR